jgi:hypothetical protein
MSLNTRGWRGAAQAVYGVGVFGLAASDLSTFVTRYGGNVSLVGPTGVPGQLSMEGALDSECVRTRAEHLRLRCPA